MIRYRRTKIFIIIDYYFVIENLEKYFFAFCIYYKDIFFLLTDLAVYEARSRNLLPYWLQLKFLPLDDHCDAMYAQIGAIDSYSHCVHLFLGPACDYCVGKLY